MVGLGVRVGIATRSNVLFKYVAATLYSAGPRGVLDGSLPALNMGSDSAIFIFHSL